LILGHQVPVDQVGTTTSTRCCSSGNAEVLSGDLSHSACLPLEIPDDDVFFSPAKVGCLNMVRSQIASSPADVQFGKLMS
jgi:hypothetical protein